MVQFGVIDLFPHGGTNWATDGGSSIAIRSDRLWNSPFNICQNVFWILSKLGELAKEIDNSEFCTSCEALPEVIDSLFKLIDSVIDILN